MEMARVNPTLTFLDVSWNGFGKNASSGDDWGAVIEHNVTLTHLDLSNNHLDERNCFVIGVDAAALSNCSQMRRRVPRE